MDKFTIFLTIIILGPLLLLICLRMFILARKDNQQRGNRDWLQQHGTRITGYVRNVDVSGSSNANTGSDLAQGANILLDGLAEASPRQITLDQKRSSGPSPNSPLAYQITVEWEHPKTHKSCSF